MNKKGFTLIELLSVVIILSIIIFLVLPNVTNLSKSHEEETNDLTLNLIENAAKLHIEDNKIFYKKIDGNNYCIRINKLVKNDYLSGRIEYNNEDITDTKSIQVTYNQGFSFELVDNASCIGDIIGCTVVKGDGTKIGDEIECGGEYFYVIDNDGSTISMLAKYNLNAGNNVYSEGTVGIQNENARGWASGTAIYANIVFSSTNYWYDTTNSTYKTGYTQGTSGYYYIYDSNSTLYEYIENYETYLKEKGVNNASGILISYEQLEKLGCSETSSSCNSSQYSWLYYTTYWSGSTGDDYSGLWSVGSDGFFGIRGYSHSVIGLRPVINISVNEI